MKMRALLATALAMVSGAALAADLPVKAAKAPPAPAFDPWDIAFGSAIMNDYIFRGVTQSNHKPSVALQRDQGSAALCGSFRREYLIHQPARC